MGEVAKLIGRIDNYIDLETVAVGKTRMVRSNELKKYIIKLYGEYLKASQQDVEVEVDSKKPSPKECLKGYGDGSKFGGLIEPIN